MSSLSKEETIPVYCHGLDLLQPFSQTGTHKRGQQLWDGNLV